MTIDDAIYLLGAEPEFGDVWIDEEQGREIGKLLRTMEAQLKAADELANQVDLFERGLGDPYYLQHAYNQYRAAGKVVE